MNEPHAYSYATHLDILFPALSLVDVDLEDKSIDLKRQHGFVVPRGVVHRTRAPERAVILMVETAAIIPPGDA